MCDDQEVVCRICLKISDDNNIIDEVMSERFAELLIKVDFCISTNPKICENCTEMVLRCHNFKLACLSTEELVFGVSVENPGEQLSLRDIYLKENENNTTESKENCDLCRFCKKCASRKDLKSFEALKDELLIHNDDMFLKYIPEMDFGFTKDPVVCKCCVVSLGIYFNFAKNCCDTEEKIINYCIIERKNHVKLNEVVKFISENTQESVHKAENEFVDVSTIKEEENSCEGPSYGSINLDKILVKAEQEQLYIKDEEIKYKNYDLTLNNTCEDPLMLQFPNQEEEISEDPLCYKTEKFPNTTLYKCEQCVYETNHKPNMTRHMLVHVESAKIHKCDICGFSTKYIKYHMLVHEGPSNIKIPKCETCGFTAKNKPSLKRHMLVHAKVFKCDKCNYNTKYKQNLKTHMLHHTNLKKFKCDFCSFSAKRVNNLKRHLLIHTDPSDLEIHRCDECDFSTKYKHNLKKHMVVHADPLDCKMYKCETCSFQTKHKPYFKKHMLGHAQAAQEICGVYAERQEDLEHHMLVHADPADPEAYKCEVCHFVTKHSQSLKRHMLVHRDSSKLAVPCVEVQNVNCEIKNEEL